MYLLECLVDCLILGNHPWFLGRRATNHILHEHCTIPLVYPTRSINHAFGIPTNDVKLVMGLENTLTIFLQAKIHDITSTTVNPDDMLDNTLSWNTNLEQNLRLLTPWIQIWESKVENLASPNFHLLKDIIECFVLSVVTKTAKILMTMINMFYPTTSLTYVSIAYPRSKGVPTGFPLTFPDIVF